MVLSIADNIDLCSALSFVTLIIIDRSFVRSSALLPCRSVTRRSAFKAWGSWSVTIWNGAERSHIEYENDWSWRSLSFSRYDRAARECGRKEERRKWKGSSTRI